MSNIDRIEIVANGVVQIRRIIDGAFVRSIVEPGADYSNEDDRVKAVCTAVHTSEVIEAYKVATTAQGV